MDNDSDAGDIWLEEGPAGSILRWLPRLVVLCTVVGFGALAVYAYRTGTQSMDENDLIVVEADKTPMKEMPEDPGGMKFPNQDKTVFETFAGNAPPPKVERVMPAPEEPMAKADASQTQTWVNDSLQQKQEEAPAAGKPEQIMGSGAMKEMAPPAQDKPAPSAPVDHNIVSYTMDKALAKKEPEPETKKAEPVKTEVAKPVKIETSKVEPAQVETAKVETAKVEPAKPVKIEAPAKKTPAPVAAKADNGKGPRVQLGAYRSDAEAKTAFAKMGKKFPVLSGKKPIVVKADLGAKGIFYRLRVGGFASADAAKDFCKGISAKGQACILAP